MKKNRVNSVDLLRGIMAISVMIYHYTSWSVGGLDASNLWSRFGLYAVTIFYFISGFSLAYVYWDEVNFKIKGYLIRRFFRIAPLFYFVSILALASQVLKTGDVDIVKVFLNFTFLFSVVDPTAYYSTGAWSIGNEMFFYFIFALILISNNRRAWLYISVFISLIGVYYFRHVALTPSESLSSQWGVYIDPLNHALCFLLGVCTYSLREWLQIISKKRIFHFFLISASMIIFLYPVQGDRINLVTGIETVLMMISSYALFVLFLLNQEKLFFNTKISGFLGDISFSVYLVHPFCWFFIKKVCLEYGVEKVGVIFWGVSIVFTLIVSFITYQLVEKTGIAFGKRFIKTSSLNVKL